MNQNSIPLIILAAGKSSRMGQPKGLMNIAGEQWIVRQARLFFEFSNAEIYVVAGSEFAEYRQALAHLKQVTVIENQKVDLGSYYSLQQAISILGSSQSAFMKPVDTPMGARSVFEGLRNYEKQLLAGHRQESYAIVPEYYGRGGHPVLLSANLLNAITQRDPRDESSRLDWVIRDLPSNMRPRVAVDDPNICLNINYESQWDEWTKSQH